MSRSVELEKDLLGRVLCPVPVAEQSVHKAVDVIEMLLEERGKRLRLTPSDRWKVMRGLLSHGEDSDDHNLPLMDWYAFEPLAAVKPDLALQIALEAKVPNILTFTVRRIAAMEGEGPLVALTANLARVDDEAKQLAILRGVNEALRGRRSVAMPKGWEAVEAKLSGSGNIAR